MLCIWVYANVDTCISLRVCKGNTSFINFHTFDGMEKKGLFSKVLMLRYSSPLKEHSS